MAEKAGVKYSEETKAIIDRLKAEGDLLRNSGTNSVRSVKIELQKFNGVFESISKNILDQSSMLKSSLKINREQLEEQRRAKDFSEVAGTPADGLGGLRTEAERLKLLNDIEDEKERAKQIEERNKTTMADRFSGLLGFFKTALVGALAGAVVFKFSQGFLKGALGDEKYNELVTSIQNIPKTLEEMGKLQLAFTALSAILGIVAAGVGFWYHRRFKKGVLGRMDEMLGTMRGGPTVLGGPEMPAPGQRDTRPRSERRREAREIAAEIMRRGQNPQIPEQPPTPSRGEILRQNTRNLLNVRSLLLGTAGSLLLGYGAGLSSVATDEMDLSPEELSKVKIRNATGAFFSDVAGGATMGMMFGPKGALIGAIAGGVWSLGKAAYNFVSDSFKENEQRLPASLEAALQRENQMLQSGGTYRAGETTSEDVARQEIEKMNAEIADLNKRREEIEVQKQRLVDANRQRFATGLPRGFTRAYDSQIDELNQQILQKEQMIRNTEDVLKRLEATPAMTAEDYLGENISPEMSESLNSLRKLDTISMNTQRILDIVAAAGAMSGTPVVVTNSPNIMPQVTNVIKGGSQVASTQVTNVGGFGGNSMGMPYALPNAVS